MRNWINLAAVIAMTTLAQTCIGSEAILRAGLDPAKFLAGATSVVSVRAPWTEAARVAFGKVDVYNTDGNLARLGPGEDEVQPAPRAQLIWTADVDSGYAIDCLIAGEAQSFLATRFEGGREKADRRDMPVVRKGDHLSFFMAKGTAGNVYLHSVGGAWAFKECAIIAVTER